MSIIERSIEVPVPASTAYDVWTQFELFPSFMEGVEEVRQTGDRHVHWRAKVWGRTEEWDAEITEQIPDKRIAWRSDDGAWSAGVVTFHRLTDDTSRVMLQMEYEPDRVTEKVGDALGLLTRRVDRDLRRFAAFAKEHGSRIQGWRGEIPSLPDSGQKSRGERVG